MVNQTSYMWNGFGDLKPSDLEAEAGLMAQDASIPETTEVFKLMIR